LAFAAIDLDGTLLDADGQVTATMEDGLRAVRSRGIRLIVATGRSPYLVRQLGLRPGLLSLFEPVMILRDGDIIWDRDLGAAVYQRFLPPTVMSELAGTFDHVVCEYPHEVVATTRQAAMRYALFYGFPRSAVRLDPCPAVKEGLKAIAFHDPAGGAPPPLHLDGTGHRFDAASGRVVVTPHGSCKAAGLDYVLSTFYGERGFTRVMAIGDGPNDECLLGAVRNGIAVANAERATAARASRTLAVPLEAFLGGFDGMDVDEPRKPERCGHIDDWMADR
jgi:hydroxymethylpyrimidine pyrophosphatase-like HAD family hydrolase